MGFRGDDDYEYVDDDDFYDLDDEDDDDEDEELGGDWRSRLGSNRSSSLPGRDRSSGSTYRSSSPSSSVYGGSKPATGNLSPGSNNPRSKVSPYSSGGSSSSNRPSTTSYSSGGTRDSLRDRVSRSGDTGNLRSPVDSGSKQSDSKDWRSQLSDKTSSKSPSPGGNRIDVTSKSADKDEKKDDSGGGFGSMLGGLRNKLPGSGDDKPGDNKPASKDEKKDDSGGGFGSMLGGLRNKLPVGGGDDKADDKKPAVKDGKKDDSGGGGFGSMLGGLRNKLPGGDDKASDSKPTGSTDKKPTTGGMSSRMGSMRNRSMGSSNKSNVPTAKAVNKDDKKSDSGSGGLTSRLGGGLRNRFGGGGDKDANKDATDSKSTGSFRNRDAKSSGKQSAFASSKSGKDDKGSGDSGGGLFSNLFSRVRSDDSSSSSSSSATKQRTSKAPKLESDEWFDLDRKLDLVGVGLVFGAIILFASAVSQEQAAISAIHNFIGQLFGWGAMAVPVSMFAIGMWLIVRHFGDDAPTIDPVRLAGLVIGFIAVLTLFQYWDSFGYIEEIPKAQNERILDCSLEFEESCTQDIRNLSECDVSITAACLEGLVKYSYEQGEGGGLLGGWLYLTLVNSITEIGGFILVAMVLTFAIMMVTRLSMAEIAVVFIGIGRSLRTSMAQNAARRRAQKLREQQQKALEAQAASISVSTPAPAQLPGFSNANALPEPSGEDGAIPISERDILIRRGGQAFSSKELEQQPVLLGANNQSVENDNSGGFFSRLFNRNKQEEQPVPQTNATTAAVAATAGTGIMDRLLNRGGDDDHVPQPQPSVSQPQPVPTHTSNMPIGGQPPVQQPSQNPQSNQPVQQPLAFDSSAQNTPAVPNPTAQPQQPSQQPTTSPQPQQQTPPSQADAMTQRQDRLNAIRSGKTAPQPAVQPQETQPTASNGNGGSGDDYNPFGRPDDIPTHESENLPGQQFSTSRPTRASDQPQINPAQNQVQKPVSSGPVNQSRKRVNWKLPDYRTLLSSGSEQEFDREQLLNQARIIEETLASFGAPGRVVEVNTGPVITQFGVEPDYLTSRSGKKSRVKVSAIAQLDKDLQLALGAKTIRVEAPVPGKGYVGIEVPNPEASLVSLRDVMESEQFQKIKSPLGIALGMSVDGTPISADLTQMPHLLIAGTTGSGKSVCVNAIINSIVATNSPEQVKFIMVDPKRVELTGYNNLPHLVAPVVVELERIVGVLKWVTREMDERYKKFSNAGARNIIDYNKHRDPNLEPMPYIVVIIDELADLMMLAPEETERTITRIAALARATGIHLVIATQRPSVDVVTGLIKANFPARIAFAVAGGVDSRVILDQPGAERLLGKGDMLYLSGDSPAPLRLQGVFVSDLEIDNISRYWKMQAVGVEEIKPISVLTTPTSTSSQQATSSTPTTPTQHASNPTQAAFWDNSSSSSSDEPEDPQQLAIEDKTGNPDPQEDELYQTAVDMVRRLDKASISLLQRRLRIGYTRAARLIDMMEERGVVGPAKEGSSKPRDVIPT